MSGVAVVAGVAFVAIWGAWAAVPSTMGGIVAFVTRGAALALMPTIMGGTLACAVLVMAHRGVLRGGRALQRRALLGGRTLGGGLGGMIMRGIGIM
jgi:hypothetical protein